MPPPHNAHVIESGRSPRGNPFRIIQMRGNPTFFVKNPTKNTCQAQAKALYKEGQRMLVTPAVL